MVGLSDIIVKHTCRASQHNTGKAHSKKRVWVSNSIEALTLRHRLNGHCNLQTREIDGRQIVLEINARMSGGMAMSCPAAVNLPLLAVLAASGRVYPEPVYITNTLHVAMVEKAQIINSDWL